MAQNDVTMEILSRIIALETRLAAVVERIDSLVDLVESRHNLIAGDGKTPSILSRVIALENFNTTLRWSLGILYTALISLVVAYIKDKV